MAVMPAKLVLQKLARHSVHNSDMFNDACILVASASSVEFQGVMRAHVLL